MRWHWKNCATEEVLVDVSRLRSRSRCSRSVRSYAASIVCNSQSRCTSIAPERRSPPLSSGSMRPLRRHRRASFEVKLGLTSKISPTARTFSPSATCPSTRSRRSIEQDLAIAASTTLSGGRCSHGQRYMGILDNAARFRAVGNRSRPPAPPPIRDDTSAIEPGQRSQRPRGGRHTCRPDPPADTFQPRHAANPLRKMFAPIEPRSGRSANRSRKSINFPAVVGHSRVGAPGNFPEAAEWRHTDC